MQIKYYSGMQVIDILHEIGGDKMLETIERFAKEPSAITHCDNCQEWHPREATEYGFCVRFGQYTKQSDYCSYGK